jgi:hypothetical protein
MRSYGCGTLCDPMVVKTNPGPLSARCDAVLTKPPDCADFRAVRAYVMCRAWQIKEQENRDKLPVSEAWAEARKACEK